MSSTALAFLGDGIHSAFVRSMLVEDGDFKSGELAKREKSEVCARAQSDKMSRIMPLLTDEEKGVAFRARNAHTNNKAKNASRGEYRLATAYEAVLGFLYITGDKDRLNELLSLSHEKKDDEN